MCFYYCKHDNYTSWYDECLPEELEPGSILSSEMMEIQDE